MSVELNQIQKPQCKSMLWKQECKARTCANVCVSVRTCANVSKIMCTCANVSMTVRTCANIWIISAQICVRCGAHVLKCLHGFSFIYWNRSLFWRSGIIKKCKTWRYCYCYQWGTLKRVMLHFEEDCIVLWRGRWVTLRGWCRTLKWVVWYTQVTPFIDDPKLLKPKLIFYWIWNDFFNFVGLVLF